MTPWFPFALSVIVVGALGMVWWLTRREDRLAAKAREERADRDLAGRPPADLDWFQGLNPQKAADQREAGNG